MSSDHPSRILFEEGHVVVGWDQNPALQHDMTREVYFELGHVTSRFGKSRVPSFEDSFMRRMKQPRRVEVVAPSFLSVPGLLVGTMRIATMHRRLAQQIAAYAPLAIRELPFDVPPIREAVQWHISNNNDAAIRWVIERIALAAEVSVRPVEKVASNVVPLGERRVAD